MKNQRGITLIALVVTIVVLLILAGITISFVLADGGIIDTAKSADGKMEIAAIREYASAAAVDLTAYALAPSGYDEDATALSIFKANFPSGTTFSEAATATATYDATNSAVDIDVTADVTVPGFEDTYTVTVDYSSAGKTIEVELKDTI